MTTIVGYTEPFSQDDPSADLDNFEQDYSSELLPEHLQEWLDSGVDEKLTRLNVHSVKGAELFELLRPKATATQSGTGIRQGDRKFLDKCLESVGWECNGRVKPTAGPLAIVEEYFCKKTQKRKKTPKYLQAEGVPLRATFLRVPEHIWQRVSEKRGVPMPKNLVIGRDGEAIGFWGWVLNNNIPVVFTEGEKKAGCLLTLGYAAISLPGMDSGYRVTERDGFEKAVKRALAEDLVEFDTPGREITILFDYREGDYSESPEFRAATTTAKLFKNAIAKIAILPGPDKGVDDFCVAGGDIDTVLADAKDYRKLAIKNQWRRDRRYTPTHTINSRYFHAPAPATGTITGIKSGLATGKTQWLKDIIASNPEGKIIVLGGRNGLLLQTAEKCGFYHLNAHNGYLMFKDPNARLCLCFDSLLKLPPEIFEGATIILDEAESVLRHLLMSPTLKRYREAIKERFAQGCKDADRIILLDGHLTDYTVGLVSKLAGNKAATKYLNEFKGNCPKISIYQTEKATPTAAEKQDFINKILASDCPAIATDCSVAEAEALEIALIEAKGKGLLICSKTADYPDQLEFQANPDVWIEKNNPNWILYTPTLENGLDASIRGKFDVFGLFCGNLGANSLIQMLRRVRHPMNQISVLCPQIGLTDNTDRRSYYASQIKVQIEVSITIEMQLLAPEELQEMINTNIDSQRKNPLFNACCNYEAQKNLEKSELRAFLIEALRDGGYEVDEPAIGADESGDHADKKIACKEKEAQEIFNSPDISLEEAQEISRSNKARWPERCQAEKCFLKARLPGIEDTKLWGWEFIDRIRSKDRSLLSQLENSWLFHNPDDAEYLQKSKWESGKFESFLPDHSPQWLKLKALHKLQISQFLNPDPDACWNNESPEIKKLLRDGSRADARKILGEPGKDGIKYLNRLLGLIGRKLVHKQARGEDGKRIHEYRYQPQPTIRLSRKGPIRICSLPEDWPELAELTAARMSQKIEAKKAATKSAETDAAYSLDAVTDASDFININIGSSVTEITPEITTVGSAAEPEAESPIASLTGWVNRWGKWCEARILGWCDAGIQYKVQFLQASGELGEMLVFPEKFFTAEGGA